jgi:hypothetical protein
VQIIAAVAMKAEKYLSDFNKFQSQQAKGSKALSTLTSLKNSMQTASHYIFSVSKKLGITLQRIKKMVSI